MRFLNWAILALGTSLLSTTPVWAESDIDISAADITKGEKVFKKCKACHTIESGEKNKTGPNLYGIVGAAVAASDDYKYSTKLIEYGGEWTLLRLNAFLTKPRTEVKGTKMSFSGLKKEKDRVNLIAYLNNFSDSPPISDTNEAAIKNSETDDYDFGLLFDAAGVEATFYACNACHSEKIVAQQGLTLAGWEETLEWMVDEQGMSEIDEPDRTEILNYLAAHYNVDRPNFPQPIN